MLKSLFKLIYNKLKVFIISINLFFIGVKYTESIVKQNIMLEELLKMAEEEIEQLKYLNSLREEIINLKNIKIERLQQ